jgi:hypothetical protein
MSLIPQQALPDWFLPYEAFTAELRLRTGNLSSQEPAPSSARGKEAQIASAVLLATGALARVQKEPVPLTVASQYRTAASV